MQKTLESAFRQQAIYNKLVKNAAFFDVLTKNQHLYDKLAETTRLMEQNRVMELLNLQAKVISTYEAPEAPQFNVREMIEEMGSAKAQLAEEERRYRETVLDALTSIQKNTVLMSDVVELLTSGNEQQAEINELLKELASIAKAETEEEAKTFYRRAVDKVSNTIKDVDTMVKLMNYANLIYNAFISNKT